MTTIKKALHCVACDVLLHLTDKDYDAILNGVERLSDGQPIVFCFQCNQ
jgi:hypothetical protein